MTRNLIVLALVLVGCEQHEQMTSTKHIAREGTLEMRPLNWRDVYRVSKRRRVATEEELAVLQQQCGQLPAGYKEFVTDFGFGRLDDVNVAAPETITKMTPFLRDTLEVWLEFCEESGDPAVIPSGFVKDAIPLAVTDWGNQYFVSPSQPGVFWHIYRSHEWADSPPCVIPLGFTNPFLHQNADGTVTQLGGDAPVFHPDVPRYSQCFAVVPKDRTRDSHNGLEDFFQDVESILRPDKIEDVDTIRIAYVARWGAEFNFGRRRKLPHFSIICRADPESEEEIWSVLSALSGRGYAIEMTDWE